MTGNVCIIGQGFVGTALRKAFSKHYNVHTYDKFKDGEFSSISDASSGCDITFVCVPTPMAPDGECDTSIVESVCKEIDTNSIVAIKSTATPGTTSRISSENQQRVVFNPEFLLERNATEDFKNTSRIILGGTPSATKVMKQFYLKVFPKASIVQTTSETAEFVKYLTNCFLAAKVSIANEFCMLCDAVGVDYDKVIEYATYDDRLGNTHFAVPGPDGRLGFGGSCFPKDLNGIIHFAKKLGLNLNTLEGAWSTNIDVRPERDWEKLKGRAVQ